MNASRSSSGLPTRRPGSTLTAHRPDHEDVLADLASSGRWARCQAVLVPTSRGAGDVCSGIRLAASIAAVHDCPLVVLTSADASTPEGRRHIETLVREAGGGQVVLVVVPLESVAPDLLRLAVDRSSLAGRTYHEWPGRADTATKRNVGLLLARRERWDRVLFLDDDIVADPQVAGAGRLALDAWDVGLVMGALDRGDHAVVGWAAVARQDGTGHADNSVICRIRRSFGYRQGVFIGGGALAVRVDDDVPFFPRIYNEDWLFCIRVLVRAREGTLALAGHVTQDDPRSAVDEQRAVMEEPGDILAEALMNLAATPEEFSGIVTSKEFWKQAMADRYALVRELETLLAESGRSDDDSERAARALSATDRVHDDMRHDEDGWARDFVDYVQAWLADDTWRHTVRAAAAGNLPAGVAELVPARVEDLVRHGG